MVASDSITGICNMTVSGGGLTWVAKAEGHAAGNMYAGVWIADYVAPAIAHDTQTLGPTGTDNTTTGSYTTTGAQTALSHAAAAGARAAVVCISQTGTASDEVGGVTYGGAAMTRLRFDTEATEPGATYIYWIDGIAGGTQNVVLTTTGSNIKKMVVSTMVTDAGRAVAVAGHNTGTSASVANPSWTISGLTAGTLLEAYEVIHSGLQTMTTTPAASWTLQESLDEGAVGRGFARQEVGSSGTTLACGWTAATADDFVGSSVAFYALPAPPRSPPGACRRRGCGGSSTAGPAAARRGRHWRPSTRQRQASAAADRRRRRRRRLRVGRGRRSGHAARSFVITGTTSAADPAPPRR